MVDGRLASGVVGGMFRLTVSDSSNMRFAIRKRVSGIDVTCFSTKKSTHEIIGFFVDVPKPFFYVLPSCSLGWLTPARATVLQMSV